MAFPPILTRRQTGWAALMLLSALAWFALPSSLRQRIAPIARAATFTVTNTNDNGAGSLRQAIVTSNLNMGPSANTINFNIPSGAGNTISPLSPLPVITAPVTIDGFLQAGPGNSRVLIELEGSQAGANANGLTITAGNCNIYSLVINRFKGAGVRLQDAGGNLIAGNLIGTDTEGILDRGNTVAGISIVNSNGNTIRENLISGNDGPGVALTGARLNTFAGNQIGTNATTTVALPNSNGIALDQDSADNIIGAPVGVSSVINVIAGNTFVGIAIAGNHNLIRNNYIGNNGASAIPNGIDGIYILGGSGNVIGGTSYSTTNVISGNLQNGIEILSAAAVGNQVLGNFIGTGAAVSGSPIPNGAHGIFIDSAASNTMIGGTNTAGSLPQNFIAHNKGDGIHLNRGFDNKVVGNYIHDNVGAGVFVNDPGLVFDGDTLISGNRIFNDGTLGIDLAPAGVTPNDVGDADGGANLLQNYPVLSAAFAAQGKAFVAGTLNSKPNATYRIEFFANNACDSSGYGEAEKILGFTSVTTNSAGNAGFQFNSGSGSDGADAGQFAVATATDAVGNTSELSQCLLIQNGGTISLASASARVFETAGNIALRVNRSNSAIAATVDYATRNGTALAGSDFTAASGTLSFDPGELSKTIVIPILNDQLAEGAEAFSLTISNPTGGASLGLPETTVVIDDDEIPSSIVYAITADNHLLSFNSTRPEVFFENRPIVGEKVFGIDFRPATGQLYAVGESGRLYTINLSNVTLTQVGTSLIPNGSFDFNPVTDRIRVANANGNFEVNPTTGTIVTTGTPLAFAAGDPNFGIRPTILGLAHTNNMAGATATTTYGIQWTGAFDGTQLVTVGSLDGNPLSPNSGQLFTVGQMGPSTASYAGFDVSDTGEAFVSLAHPEEGVFATFYKLNLATGSTQPLGTLIDPNHSGVTAIAVQPAEKVQFKTSIFSVNEYIGEAAITITRSAVGGNTQVDYSTSDGTARAGIDYLPASGSIGFSPGQKSATFPVTIFDDALIEGVESINLSLTVTATDSGGLVGKTETARIAIMDEPAEAGTNAIDNADFFVRQHYADFLNRTADSGGLAFWTNHITECFNDQACVNDRRIGVSAAFFIENEFQQTGFFIYRFYQAALGRRPTYAEFNADRGQVIGGADLEKGKQAFAGGFVQRPAFLQAYPLSMDGPAFVDAVIMTAGQASGLADLSTRRAGLLSQYNSGANQNDSRVRVLRSLIDDSAFVTALYNPAFVLMQYFGYLRRPPDQTGYNFWLDHLNNRTPNNYRAMVCAFITSHEYQRRFGQVISRSNQDCPP
ncbi:MAG: Na-Ca exchanger/integrin-beta4 [Acidobacteria bacterium]|nr:Na-Ca exchanger/integrin-beta4 [Acidobacteriota bacterium]